MTSFLTTLPIAHSALMTFNESRCFVLGILPGRLFYQIPLCHSNLSWNVASSESSLILQNEIFTSLYQIFLFLYIHRNYHDLKLHSSFTIACLFPVSLVTVPESKFHEGKDLAYLVYCSSLASRIRWTLNKHLLSVSLVIVYICHKWKNQYFISI